MASTRLVAHFFTTRSIKNLWGLAAKRTVIDKQTYSALEWTISVVIGFIVFEVISKWVKKKAAGLLPKYMPAFLKKNDAEKLQAGENNSIERIS